MRRRALRLLLLAAALGLLAAALGAPVAGAQGGKSLTTTLSGAEEVPNPGDPDGSGVAHLRLNSGQGTVCFEIEFEGVEPLRAGHIHRAPAGEAGPVVVPLFNTPAGTASSPITGCADASRELVKQIRKNPSAYYVNVHNQPFPAGALRGQLGD